MNLHPTLLVSNLSFAYRGADRPALDGIQLELQSGQWGLLVGPAGAGKSTLVKCLNRTIPQFHPGELSGRVWVAGVDICGLRVPQAARHGEKQRLVIAAGWRCGRRCWCWTNLPATSILREERRSIPSSAR